MIRVLQFADVINRHDFIDTIIQSAEEGSFEISVCLKSDDSNIARPAFRESTKRRILEWKGRPGIPATAWKLSNLLKEWEIDIVHAHHFDPAVIAWLATRIHRKTKFVFGRHYSDLIQSLPDPKRRYFLAVEQMMNRAAERIIVPSTMIADILTEKQHVDRSKIDIVPYGFAAEKYSDIAETEIKAAGREFGFEGRFVVASVGKLTAGKGVRFLADAAAMLKGRIPNLLVLFIGEGEERTYIEELIESQDLSDTIKIAGWRTDAVTLLAGADIVVQPTLSEAFSQVMGEAMWMQKPLVMTDVSGATDIIQTGVNGILIPRGNSGALATAIEELFADAEARERIGNAGKRFVEEELAIGKVIKLYENSYRRALS